MTAFKRGDFVQLTEDHTDSKGRILIGKGRLAYVLADEDDGKVSLRLINRHYPCNNVPVSKIKIVEQ